MDAERLSPLISRVPLAVVVIDPSAARSIVAIPENTADPRFASSVAEIEPESSSPEPVSVPLMIVPVTPNAVRVPVTVTVQFCAFE